MWVRRRVVLLVHGWPGSVAEFTEVIDPLVDPVAHGGTAADAFHVVAPSLPGFGFSGPTTERGWDVDRIGRAFAELMSRLDYPRFFYQGGDWGSPIGISMAGHFPDRVAAMHLNLVVASPPPGERAADLPPDERATWERQRAWQADEAGYQAIHRTKPQTLAYGLHDSPAGMAAWILEKFQAWSDCDGDLLRSFSLDRLCDNLSVYWVTGTIGSSIRLLHETMGPGRRMELPAVTIPFGHNAFPAETYQAPRRWLEAAFDLQWWSVAPRGGHFAAMEVPDIFVAEVRGFFGTKGL